MRCIALLLIAIPLSARDDERQAGHSIHGEAFNEGPRQQAYLIPGMGSVTFPVSAKVPEAQQFFNQGVAQLHSFYYFEAERSFRQSVALDPDLAMGYWGLAMANVNNEERAKQFLARAEKLKDKADPREKLWIAFLGEWYKQASGEKRARASIKALERIVGDYPQDVEAKAFLAWACFHFNDKGLPISSHQAVESLIEDVLRANPMHPGAHHYRIHLWDSEKASRALDSAALFGPSAPGIAHAWHMPGHIYTKLHRYGDAALQQEASARVDHAQMIRDRTMPYQIFNYAHNNQWCMQDLMYVGRVRDAVAIGENLIEIPRHPKLNKVEEASHACREGRSRLFEVLVKWELWDELLARADTVLAPLGVDEDEVIRLRALGTAYFAKGDAESGRVCIAGLEMIHKKITALAGSEKEGKDDKKKEGAYKNREKTTKAAENAIAELKGLAEPDAKAALAHFAQCADLSKEVLARAQGRAGLLEEAEKTARQAAEVAEGQACPWACYAEVLLAAGKRKEAQEAWKKLAPVIRHADPGLPALERLKELAASTQIDLPADRPVVEGIAKLGPLVWTPALAPPLDLYGAGGRPGSLARGGGSLLVLFYLGSDCPHCVQQLGKFAELSQAFGKENISIVAVSSETPEQLARQKVSKVSDPYPFPIVPDPALNLFKSYRCFDDFEKLPLHGTFLLDVDKAGHRRIRWQDISYEPFVDAPFLVAECRRLLALRVP